MKEYADVIFGEMIQTKNCCMCEVSAFEIGHF
jgi:hypothetical protein